MKTRSIILAIAAFSTIAMLTSCEKIKGKGDVTSEVRTAANFQAISLDMSATVYFTPGAGYGIELRGQENVLREIITRVDGNRLTIRLKNNVILGSHEPIFVYVSAPDVTDLRVDGSGDIYTDGPWTTSNLSLDISGSGTINIGNLVTESLSANISGSGNIRATTGTAIREDLKISGSGTIDLRSIEAESVYTVTSGSGDTYIHAKTLLDVSISGSGDIWYYGTPAINTRISGSGNLHKM
jgi:hypothetical protein